MGITNSDATSQTSILKTIDFNDAPPQCLTEPEYVRLMTRDELKRHLQGRLVDALYHLFPKGKVVRGKFTVGNVLGHAGKSLTVELSGDKIGRWHDFETGEGSDIVSLWGAARGWSDRSQYRDLAISAQEWLGIRPTPLPTLASLRNTAANTPASGTQASQTPAVEALGTPTGKWTYQALDGAPLAWAYRYDPSSGKEIRYQDAQTGRWTIPCPRPLYNQTGMAHSDTVILVEGEKCAAALIDLGICATTAMNGANAIIDKTDWSPLIGKHVLVWPDHDEPGKGYAERVVKKLGGLGLASLALMAIPEDKPDKWDAADAVAEGTDVRAFIDSCPQTLVPLSEAEDSITVTVKEDWLDPLPIKTELLPVEPFDFNLIPDPLRDFVKDCSFRMQCPPDYIAVAMVFMFGGLIGAACGVKPKKFDDWVVIPNLWGGVVGEPSTLKTPAINEAFDPLHKVEKKAIEDYQEKLKEWESKDKVAKLREDSVKSDIKNQMKNKALSDEAALELYSSHVKEIPKPSCRRYKTNDTTIEKAHEILSQNSRGIIHYRDELVGLLTGWEKDGHESDRAFYLESWNGYGSFTVDRIGRGTIYVENICVAIFGSTQPDKIRAYIHKCLHALDNDGLAQRFQLLVYPDPLKEWRYVDQVPDQEARATFHNLAYQIARTDFFDEVNGLEEVKGKKCFSFDDEGQEAFIEWLTELEKRLKEFDEPIIIQHLAKYRKLMPALALIFHVITIAGKENKTGKIPKESVIRAICWCEYLESHARRIYGMALNISTQGACVLSKKIKRGELGQKFSLRDVYRKQWSFLKDRDSAEAACEELVKNHWIKEVLSLPAPGQKTKTEYVVNSAIETAKREEDDHE